MFPQKNLQSPHACCPPPLGWGRLKAAVTQEPWSSLWDQVHKTGLVLEAVEKHHRYFLRKDLGGGQGQKRGPDNKGEYPGIYRHILTLTLTGCGQSDQALCPSVPLCVPLSKVLWVARVSTLTIQVVRTRVWHGMHAKERLSSHTHCFSYFSLAVIKHHDPELLTGERVYSGCGFGAARVHLSQEAWQQVAGTMSGAGSW